MSLRAAPRPNTWGAPLWLWPVALSSALALWSFRCLSEPVSPWVHFALASAALVACWDVVLQGVLPFLLGHRPGRETLPVAAALVAFLASFLVTTFDVFLPLPRGMLDRVGGPVLFYDTAATILLLTLAARPSAVVWRTHPREHERVLPPMVAENWTLWASLTAVAGAFTLLVLWVFRGGNYEMALSAGLAAMIAVDPFLFLDLRAMLSVGVDRSLAAQGIRLRSRASLRDLGSCDTVVVEASGVLAGALCVETVTSLAAEESQSRVLRLAAAAEFGVRHPIGAAILEHPDVASATIPRVKGFEHVPGRGVRALLHGRELACGNLEFLREEGVAAVDIDALREHAAPLCADGQSVVFVSFAARPIGLIGLRPRPDPDAAELISGLRAAGTEVIVTSGDAAATVRANCHGLEIAEIWSDRTLAERAEMLRERRTCGRRVLVIATARHAALFEAANASIEWCQIGTNAARATNAAISVDARVESTTARTIATTVRAARVFVARVRHGQTGVALYYLALLPLVTGALEPIGGPPPSPVLAACSFCFLRQLGVRLLRVGLVGAASTPFRTPGKRVC